MSYAKVNFIMVGMLKILNFKVNGLNNNFDIYSKEKQNKPN